MSRIAAFALAFLCLLAAPLMLKPKSAVQLIGKGALQNQVIVLTPANEQVRYELSRGFAAWHKAKFGEAAEVVWSTPGGAIEIRRALVSAWESRLRQGLPVGGDADLVLGGGSYEFDTLKRAVTVQVGGDTRSATILEPLALPEQVLRDCYGTPMASTDGKPRAVEIAGQRLYDPTGCWYGVALATFGIVWNQPVIDTLGVPAPKEWVALADPRLRGWVCMVNPSQSGAVLTTFESIVQHVGWQPGLAILRRAAANARNFAPSGTRGPIDVSSGDAAMAVAIDFYGRYQAQVIADAAKARGETRDMDRVQFVTPKGQSTVDADPVGMLRNPPHRQAAERFVQYLLSAEAQRLWQLPVGAPGGPHRYQLRRLPVMRSLYASEGGNFVDKVDPYADAVAPAYPNPDMRPFIPVLFNAMAMDCHESLRGAWACIAAHPAYPKGALGVVTAADVSDPELRSWLERFDAWPEVPTPTGARSIGDAANLQVLHQGWLKGGWKDQDLWGSEDRPADVLRSRFEPFFEGNYQWIMRQAAARGTS